MLRSGSYLFIACVQQPRAGQQGLLRGLDGPTALLFASPLSCAITYEQGNMPNAVHDFILVVRGVQCIF